MYVGSSNECNKFCITASGSGNCSGVFLRNCLVFSFGSVTWADGGNTSYITQWKYLRPCQLWWMMNAKFKVGDCVRSADNPLDIKIYSIFIYFSWPGKGKCQDREVSNFVCNPTFYYQRDRFNKPRNPTYWPRSLRCGNLAMVWLEGNETRVIDTKLELVVQTFQMKLCLLSLIMKSLHTLGHLQLHNIKRIGLRMSCSSVQLK